MPLLGLQSLILTRAKGRTRGKGEIQTRRPKSTIELILMLRPAFLAPQSKMSLPSEAPVFLLLQHYKIDKGSPRLVRLSRTYGLFFLPFLFSLSFLIFSFLRLSPPTSVARATSTPSLLPNRPPSFPNRCDCDGEPYNQERPLSTTDCRHLHT